MDNRRTRDKEIIIRRLSGESYDSICKSYGIGKARVRLIFKEWYDSNRNLTEGKGK